MAYWKEKVLELTPHPGEAQEPADGVLRSARGHEGPYGGAPHDGRVAEPPVEGGSVRVGAVQEGKKEAEGRQREDQRPQRPAQRPKQAPSRRRAGSSPYSLHRGGAVLLRTRTAARANVSGLGSVPRRS